MTTEKDLELRVTVKPPIDIFRENAGRHGMGGPVSFPIESLTEQARDYLFAKGDLAAFIEGTPVSRAQEMLGREYVVGKVTEEAIEAGHFPHFGRRPY